MKAAAETLFAYSSLFLLFLQSHRCVANCTPSACGIISNISYPFRLKGDPKHCGHHGGELSCENNVTFFYFDKHNYFVKEIDYTWATIRLLDASINADDLCSFPTYTPYSYATHAGSGSILVGYGYGVAMNLISCPHPLKNSSTYTDITHCQNSTAIPSNSRFTYIKLANLMPSEITVTCSLDVVMGTRVCHFEDLNNVSLQEIHRCLLYGIELIFCVECGPFASTSILSTAWGKFRDIIGIQLRRAFIILPAIAVITSVLAIPVIGIAIALGLLFFIGVDLYFAIQHRDRYSITSFMTDMNSVYMSEKISRIVIIFGPRFMISVFLAWFWIKKFRRRHLSRFDKIESFLKSDNKLVPIRYSYSDIKKMTKNFQDKLGEGGYGSVYKGKLRSGYHVAVKLLGKSGSNDQDFMNEISTIGRIHHVNIMKLVGYCAEGSKRALVLDYMSNGSLEKYILNKERMNSINWDTKFEIVVGVARGIEYLHQGCDIQILHFDIKPHNILLDDKFIPKVSDFGLAKFFSTEKNTMTLTAARGTIGYVAPELINRGIGRVSYKADVYSYGMLLMEMVGLNRDLKGSNEDSSKYFPQWIYDGFNQDKEFKVGSFDEIKNDCDNESTRALVRKMTIVALWCIQMNPDNRPSMNKVLEMLEGEAGHLQIPRYPLEYPNIIVNKDETWGTSSTYSDSVSLLHFKNAVDVEITMEDSLTLP